MCTLRSLKNKTRTFTQLKFAKVMATPTLLYGSETNIGPIKEKSLKNIEYEYF